MRNIWIIILALLFTGCARTEYVATPNPDEISTITYQLNTPQLRRTWYFVNNDLTLRYSRQDSQGRLIASQTRKLTPNDFNWLVTQIEKTNYAKINSPSKVASSSYVGRQSRSSGAPEVISIVTLGGTYSFQRKGSIGLPPALDIIAKKIPSLFLSR